MSTCDQGVENCLYNENYKQAHVCESWAEHKERMRRVDLATEERLAWDRYAAAFMPIEDCASPDQAARVADALLEERRKRFGAGK